MAKIDVQGTEITVVSIDQNDYFSLTDMLKAKDGDFFISDWLRNRNTVEYLGIWERIHNPNFNYGEFAIIKSQAGLNSYKISVKERVEKTSAIGLRAKAGRYGGTYAHRDIAFEFGMWISPEFKIYLIKEFQRLKEAEQKQLGWDIKWREQNPGKKGNIRDYANIAQLICLSNLENLNALFVSERKEQPERLKKLNDIAIAQMQILVAHSQVKAIEQENKS
jgi:hypothetical protein